MTRSHDEVTWLECMQYYLPRPHLTPLSHKVVRVLVNAGSDSRLVRYSSIFSPAQDRFFSQNEALPLLGFELLARRLGFVGYTHHLEAREKLRSVGDSVTPARRDVAPYAI